MSVLSARTEVCAPRRSFLAVSSENQRSTRFSHEELVGREVQDEPRVCEQPALDHRGLVSGGVIEHEVDLELGRDLSVEGLQELLELDRAMPAVQLTDDLAGREIKRRVETARAMPLVVVGRALGNARAHRQDRLCAVQRLDLGLLDYPNAVDNRVAGRVWGRGSSGGW